MSNIIFDKVQNPSHAQVVADKGNQFPFIQFKFYFKQKCLQGGTCHLVPRKVATHLTDRFKIRDHDL